jgi:nucleoid-associated protein YgaU
MDMKLNVHRETTIGLSVLLVLLVILGIVAVRRLMRPGVSAEVAATAADPKPAAPPSTNNEPKAADSLLMPSSLTPTTERSHNAVQPLDDHGHWNAAGKESRTDMHAGSMAPGSIASDPPTASNPLASPTTGMAPSQPATTDTPPALAPAAIDDRYAPAAVPRVNSELQLTAATAPSPDSPTPAGSKPIVVQAGGESVDGGPRTLDRYTASSSAQQPIQPAQPSTLAGSAPPAPAGIQQPTPAGIQQPAPANGLLVGPPVAPVAPSAAGNTFGTATTQGPPASRLNYDPTSPAAAVSPRPSYGDFRAGNPRLNNTAAADGYSPDGALRAGGDAPATAQALNPLRGEGKYEVQPNESYWTISERVYGSGAYFRALAEANRGKAARPDRLPPGLVISTPAVAQLEKDYPDLCPRPNRRESVRNRGAGLVSTAGGGRIYVVQEGDTLSTIARNELGKISRWAEIYQINRETLGKDYDYLTPGLQLVLPIRDSQPVDRTTRRSDGIAPLIR